MSLYTFESVQIVTRRGFDDPWPEQNEGLRWVGIPIAREGVFRHESSDSVRRLISFSRSPGKTTVLEISSEWLNVAYNTSNLFFVFVSSACFNKFQVIWFKNHRRESQIHCKDHCFSEAKIFLAIAVMKVPLLSLQTIPTAPFQLVVLNAASVFIFKYGVRGGLHPVLEGTGQLLD